MYRSRPIVAAVGFLLTGLYRPSIGQHLAYRYYAPADTLAKYFEPAELNDLKPIQPSSKPSPILEHYRYIELDVGERVKKFRAIAPHNVLKSFDELVRQTVLHKRVDSLLQVSGAAVDITVYLFDDRNGLEHPDLRFPSRFDTTDGVWFIRASAWNWFVSRGRYEAEIRLGERAARRVISKVPGKWLAWESAILHEMFHTQFLPHPKFGRNLWDGDEAISYGGDAGHWGEELMADQQAPLEEGLADFWGFSHNKAEGDSLVRYCNSTAYRFKLGNRSLLTGVKEMWNAPHIIDKKLTGPASKLAPGFLNPAVTPTVGWYELRLYKWHDVPGLYVLHNEFMQAAFFYLFWKYGMADKDKAMALIRRAVASLARPVLKDRFVAYAANHLAKSMEAYAQTNAGRADAAAGTLRSSMIVYGLLDLVTHLGMKDQTIMGQLRTHSPSPRPKAFAAYMKHRGTVKARLQPYLTRSAIDVEKAAAELVGYFTKISSNTK